MPRRENANTPASAQAQQDAVSEGIENFELPRALVTRIAKSAVRRCFRYRILGAIFFF
jgi:DNA polymerase epsilon subunit 3